MSDSLWNPLARCCLATWQNSYCAHAQKKNYKSWRLNRRTFSSRTHQHHPALSVAFDCCSSCIDWCICGIIIKVCFGQSSGSYIFFCIFAILMVTLFLFSSVCCHWVLSLVESENRRSESRGIFCSDQMGCGKVSEPCAQWFRRGLCRLLWCEFWLRYIFAAACWAVSSPLGCSLFNPFVLYFHTCNTGMVIALTPWECHARGPRQST